MRSQDISHARPCVFLLFLNIDPVWRFLHRAAVGYATDAPEEFSAPIFMPRCVAPKGTGERASAWFEPTVIAQERKRNCDKQNLFTQHSGRKASGTMSNNKRSRLLTTLMITKQSVAQV